jgi:hypothetical protein
MIHEHHVLICVDPDLTNGSLDQILWNIENLVFGYNNAIKHNGVKKDGPSHLKTGNVFGTNRVSGRIVDVLENVIV